MFTSRGLADGEGRGGGGMVLGQETGEEEGLGSSQRPGLTVPFLRPVCAL